MLSVQRVFDRVYFSSRTIECGDGLSVLGSQGVTVLSGLADAAIVPSGAYAAEYTLAE
jgi:hypothetical protein